ncbi:: Glyoxalase_2 [Gemmata massiliana]|uniref:: Glyoxalase_2 n=2 Tax=Gemmata massiliana TaxID=1210884 RepID=A0A6P2CQM6_9BACT|nr:: Glyoxalase_2 [Gemmata massiliana]
MLQKVATGTQAPGAIGSGMSAYIRVLDIGAIRDAVAGKVPGVGPIQQRQYGCREFTVTDPDGHVLVFGECQ